MKKIQILQHVPYETSGCIENWIKDKNYKYAVTEFYNGDLIPDVTEFDWLIIMGGPMSVHDTEAYPWLVDEKRTIRQAVAAGKTVIGICLGSQLIAEVLGGRVFKNLEKEIGWFPVERINRGLKPGLLECFNDMETVFHWHGETFEIPQRSTHEFKSEACTNQCFIYNERILGLQFHIEVTESLLEEMILNGEDEIVPGRYIQNRDMIRDLSYISRNNQLMFSVLNELDKI